LRRSWLAQLSSARFQRALFCLAWQRIKNSQRGERACRSLRVGRAVLGRAAGRSGGACGAQKGGAGSSGGAVARLAGAAQQAGQPTQRLAGDALPALLVAVLPQVGRLLKAGLRQRCHRS
jgi:hypothetical protein